MDRNKARLLIGICEDLGASILPNLTSSEAIERAYFAKLVLARFAVDEALAPTYGPQFAPRYLALVDSVLGTLERASKRESTERGRSRLASFKSLPLPIENEHIQILREVLGLAVRPLTEISGADSASAGDARGLLGAIAKLDMEWRSELQRSEEGGGIAMPPRKSAQLAPAAMTNYLRGVFRRSPNLKVDSIEVLPGGRSKTTAFVLLSGTEELPAQVVMRQETGSGHMGTDIVREHAALKGLADVNLPIPTPFYCETEKSAIGEPFMLMKRLPGKVTGDFRTFVGTGRSVVEDLARMLALLHLTDTAKLAEGDAPLSQQQRVRNTAEHFWKKWCNEAVEPSPTIECAFHWILSQCDRPMGKTAIIHGDVGPHNLLAVDGRISGILDWEFVHLGDPAEDLSYCRPVVQQVMPWNDFLAIYAAEGGTPADDELLLLHDVLGIVRLASLGAGAMKQYVNGASNDFTQGAGGYFVIPYFEGKLAALLKGRI